MPNAAVLFDFSAPTSLPNGMTWTAQFVSEDWFREFKVYFDVTLHKKDGATEVFPAEIDVTADGAWDAEPGRAHRDLDRVVRDKVGVRW